MLIENGNDSHFYIHFADSIIKPEINIEQEKWSSATT